MYFCNCPLVVKRKRQYLLIPQVFPRASQGFLQSQDGGEQKVELAGFDFLDGASIQFHEFGQFFLGQIPPQALS